MTRELFVEENRGNVRRRVDRNGKEKSSNSIRKNVNSIVGFKKRRTKKNDEVYRDMVSLQISRAYGWVQLRFGAARIL